MIYWKEKHAIIENGVQRDAGDTPVEGLPLYEDSEPYKRQQAHCECEWAIAEFEATNDAVLKWFVSGKEPNGLKAYRANLEAYYLAIASGEKSERPVLDDRSILKKTWAVLNTRITLGGK